MIGLPAEEMVRVGWGASSVVEAAGAAAAVSGTATAAAAAAAISRRENIGARVRMVVPWVVARCSAVWVVPIDRRCGLPRAERLVMRQNRVFCRERERSAPVGPQKRAFEASRS